MTKKGKTLPSVFSVQQGHFSAYLYPYETQPGWAWTVWRRSNDDVVSDEIRSGHIEQMPIPAAAEILLKELFAAVAEAPQPTFRVLVCGTLPEAEESMIGAFLDKLHANRGPITELIAVGEYGVALKWAGSRDVAVAEPPLLSGDSVAQRNKNVLIATRPHFVVTFGDGRTATSMLHQAERLDIAAVKPTHAESGAYL